MGADMIAASLVVRLDPDKPLLLDWEAGRAAVEALDFAEVDENTLDELWQNYAEVDADDPRDRSEWDPKVTLHQVLKEVEETIEGGRAVAFHTYPNFAVLICGGLSWGDAPEGTQGFWTLSTFEDVAEAIGFVPWDQVVLAEPQGAPWPTTDEERARLVEWMTDVDEGNSALGFREWLNNQED